VTILALINVWLSGALLGITAFNAIEGEPWFSPTLVGLGCLTIGATGVLG
jgi:hypothetical protein